MTMESDTLHASKFESLDIDKLRESPERFLNREFSWLNFNQRVLEEANNPNNPIFERIRFLSIAASNMDEFYMVRVAGLKAQVRANITEPSIDGLLPQQQLDTIRKKSRKFITELQGTWRRLRDLLEEEDIRIISREELQSEDKQWLNNFFENEILPVLTPIAIDPSHPFPFIPSQGLSIALKLKNKDTKETMEALIQIPKLLDRFIKLPGHRSHYMLIEKVIMSHIGRLFPKPMEVKKYALFRVIRDSELEIKEDAEDLVRTFETALKKRRRGNVIHLSVYHNIDESTKNFLKEQLGITEQQIYPIDGMIELSTITNLIQNEHQDKVFKPYNARFPERIMDFGGDCFAAIRQKDILVHHPFESFDVVVQFLDQAAQDPDVVSIKQTLYRTSEDSPIVKALIDAADRGQTVTALVEIKARFDEEANLKWARDMERAGIQVVYGFLDLKTHAKVSLAVRREGKKYQSYAHFGTGNYHAINAKIYTDLSYFTCDTDLCHDAALMFNYMTGYARPANIQKLAISPINMRETLNDLIDTEIKNAQAGKPAQIWAKCNSVLDSKIIDKLYEASQAGVQIDMVVRGICTLRPGIPGLSENIRVKSVVGRFLEHSRIYCFANGQELPSRKAKVFVASADLMTRNLNRRIEAFVPIENKTVHAQILDQIMLAYLKDHKQSWSMNYDGSYARISTDPETFCAHEYFMNNPSLSGRGSALEDAPMPPELHLEQNQQANNKTKKLSKAKKN